MDSDNSKRLTLIVSLFIHAGHEAEFEQFEFATTAIMRHYGGEIERRIGCIDDGDAKLPHEVHIVTFPDEAAFERYRSDPGLRPLAELRARTIRETTILRGVDRGAFAHTAN